MSDLLLLTLNSNMLKAFLSHRECPQVFNRRYPCKIRVMFDTQKVCKSVYSPVMKYAGSTESPTSPSTVTFYFVVVDYVCFWISP